MKFNHKALLVNDLKKSGNFYKDILGLEEISVGASQSPSKRWFKIKGGMEIHLISTKENLKPVPKGTHMAFSVENFDFFTEYLTKNQVKYSNWIGDKNKIQIRKDGFKQIFFQDPQGYWLEVNNIN